MRTQNVVGKTLAYIGIVAGLLFLFGISQTYALNQDIARNAYLLKSGEIAVFMVTFPITAGGNDLYIPTSAIQSDSDAPDRDNAHYYFEHENGETILLGEAVARLYSARADLVGGTYRIPTGTTHYMTLISVLPVSSVQNTDPDDYSMRMRTLPFRADTIVNQFNRHELKSYRTDYLDLEDGSTKPAFSR